MDNDGQLRTKSASGCDAAVSSYWYGNGELSVDESLSMRRDDFLFRTTEKVKGLLNSRKVKDHSRL